MRRPLVVAVVVVLGIGALAALIWASLSREVDDGSGAGSETSPRVDQQPAPEPGPDEAARWDQPLTWAPPDVSDAEVLEITEPGVYRLRADRSYRIEAPQRIDGAVELRGGGDVVWIGGHIRIPDQGEGPVPTHTRRALMINDGGEAQPGRTVHLEGLRIDGDDLAEGINTHAPDTTVQLQNIHADGVHFRHADDRDGTGGWGTNHPDVLQTWGSQAELRIDGLTASSAYQGIFLKEDKQDRVLGQVWLRRVDVTAIQHEGRDGATYAGHRMFTYYPGQSGEIRLDSDTVYVTHHPDAGWNRARENPAAGTSFWRHRYRDEGTGELVEEPPPGDATFTDALGNPTPDLEGEDEAGPWAGWSNGPLDWNGDEPGRIHSGSPPGGSFVPADLVGTGYRSPGYREE